jgi:tRNA threonylcarbamoyladenosine biosynthesis protein TsaB
MRTLGVDTATSTASVAITEDGALVAERIVPRGAAANGSMAGHFKSNHAEVLLPLIESVLQEAAVSLAEISGLAVAIGPGSFTGLRIGLSTVKGLAYGWHIPVVGISTLLANAARVTDYDGLICPFLDARKKEVYASLFRRSGDSLSRLTEDSVLDVAEVIDLVRKYNAPCLFIGDGTATYEKLLQQSLANGVYLRGENASPSVAAAVARLGEEHCRSSDRHALLSLAPVYLRSSEAEVKRKIYSN